MKKKGYQIGEDSIQEASTNRVITPMVEVIRQQGHIHSIL